MKRMFFAAFAALARLAAFGAAVGGDDAKNAVAGWVRLREALGDEIVAEPESVATFSGLGGKGEFHVVSLKGGGYVVTSGDTGIMPILGYSRTGEFDAGDGSPMLALLAADVAGRTAALEVADGAVSAGRAGAGAAGAQDARSARAAAQWSRLASAGKSGATRAGAGAKLSSAPADLRVASFVQSKWGQQTAKSGNGYSHRYYNLYTPNNYPCGCVATAFAQTMRYFEWPKEAVDAKTFACKVGDTATDLTMQGGVYDWAHMPGVPSEVAYDWANVAGIAKLTSDAGISVCMKYASDGSGSTTFYVADSLVSTFGYSNAIADYGSGDNTGDRLKKNILPSLDAKLPVILGIQGTPTGSETKDAGHAILTDGYGYYNGELYIHLNFGWSGTDDAWYTPAMMNASNYNFDEISCTVFNIFTNAAKYSVIASGRVLDQDGNPISGATVTAKYNNAAAATATSDARGVYALVLPPTSSTRTYTVDATHDEYTSMGALSVGASRTKGDDPIKDGNNYTDSFYSRYSNSNSYGNDITMESKNLPQAATPESPTAAEFGESASVELACATAGASIYYTLDGTTPTDASALYTGPITLTKTTTVKARAFKRGNSRSDVFERTFVSAAAIDEYYFRHDFSGGSQAFIAGEGAGLTRDQMNRPDSSNAKAVAGPAGPGTAFHPGIAWGPFETPSVLHGAWTAAMSLCMDDTENGVLASFGRLNTTGQKEVALLSSSVANRLYFKVMTTDSSGAKSVENTFAVETENDMTAGFHSIVLVYTPASGTLDGAGAFAIYCDGVLAGIYSSLTSKPLGNGQGGIQYCMLVSGAGALDALGAVSSQTNDEVAFHDFRFYDRAFTALEAAKYAAAYKPSPAWSSDQYWTGGANGLWSGANWAYGPGGEGKPWTDGDTGWFTTSPSVIDLAGASPTVANFKTSGFSAASRCAIDIVNTGGTPSTMTFTGLDAAGDDGLKHAGLSFSNVAVVDESASALEVVNGTRVAFGQGSTFAKTAGDVSVGSSSATSNEVAIAAGAGMSVPGNLWVGCSKGGVCATGVVHVAGGTLNVAGQLRTGNSAGNDGSTNKGFGALVIDGGGEANVAGETHIGCAWKSGASYAQTSEIRVNSGGTLNLAKVVVDEYGTKNIVIDGGLLKTGANFEPGYGGTSGLYKSRNFTLSVLNGGVLEVGGNFWMNSYNKGKETIVFDGGTFRAGKDLSTQNSSAGNGDYTDFTVGAGGMTIDTQGYTVNWPTKIDGGAGKVTKAGSGKLNLTWTPSSTGGFDINEGTLSFGLSSGGSTTRISSGELTVKSGATLELQAGNNPSQLAPRLVFKDGAKLNLPYSGGAVGAVKAGAIALEGALDVAFSATPGPGEYVILAIAGEGTFAASALSNIALPGSAFMGAKLSLSADAKSVVLAVSGDSYWIGGASGSLGDAANWSKGVVPQAGVNAIITADEEATLTSSAAFKATTITFPAGCPKITIEGEEPLAGVEAIVNQSSANHEFKAAVAAGALTISNATTYCVFTGGLEADSVAFAETGNGKCAIYGDWRIKGDWTPVSGNALGGGASVTVDGALLNPNNLSIEAGCVVTAATLKATGNCGYLTYSNKGRLVVAGLCEIATLVDCYLTRKDANDNATVEFGSFYANSPGKWTYFNAKHAIVGADGIDCATGIHFYGNPVLHAKTGGFSLKGTGGGNYTGEKAGVTIDTTQYGTEDVPATVTIDAVYRKQHADRPGKMTATGCGTVLFNSVSGFGNGLTVSGSATVAVNAGKQPGAGTVTVQSGATLQVAQSGAVAPGGALTLADGAALGFNFTDKTAAPVLDVSGRTVTVNGAVKVKISAGAEGESFMPERGKYTLVSGGKFAGADVSLAENQPEWARVSVVDGDIVLSVAPKGTRGFRILVK